VIIATSRIIDLADRESALCGAVAKGSTFLLSAVGGDLAILPHDPPFGTMVVRIEFGVGKSRYREVSDA
jgi:hypothetical protein